MYLLDTDTIIYSLKDVGNVNENLIQHSDVPKAISVITYGELVYGAEKSLKKHENLAKTHRIAELFPVFDNFIRFFYDQYILHEHYHHEKNGSSLLKSS